MSANDRTYSREEVEAIRLQFTTIQKKLQEVRSDVNLCRKIDDEMIEINGVELKKALKLIAETVQASLDLL